MSALKRFLSFVPPILLFVLPAYTQIQGKLIQLPGNNTYQVSIIPTMDMAPPMSATGSAQITVRAKSGKLDPVNLQSITGDWGNTDQFASPIEAPDYDYFVFSLINPLTSVTYDTGVEMPLFTFENNNICTIIELVDNATDPFASSNTLMINSENYFSIVVAGGNNGYEGNTAEFQTSCPQVGLDVMVDLNPLLCHGDLTNLHVQALEGIEPYSVTFTNTSSGATGNAVINTFEGTTTFSNVPAGDYEIVITDSQDSTNQTDIKIEQPTELTVTLAPGAETCLGSSDGNLVVASVWGVSGTDLSAYQYYWDIDPNNSSTSIESLSSGTYTVTVVDMNGCSLVESAFVGFFTDSLYIHNTVVDISCYGENDGIIDITPVIPAGGGISYNFRWSPNANTADGQTAAWMLGPGEYQVTVSTDSGNCPRTETFTIEEPGELTVDYETVEPICFGDPAFLNILSVNNAQGDYQIDITGNYTQLTDSNFEVEPGLPIQLTLTDSRGCEATEDFLIPDKPEMTVQLGDDQTITYGESVLMESEVFPLTGVDFEWISSDSTLSCMDCPNPIAAPLITTNYILRMTDVDGCSAEDDIKITVEKPRNIYIPTAFSPNKDGINDIFRPYGGFEIVEIKNMMIFDRWGGLLFSDDDGFKIEDVKIGWDGTTRGKDLDPGIYIYSMNVEFIDGEVILFAGEFNLMK